MAKGEPGWELYRSFLAVLRSGSLSAAARSLGLTQPTVGRHIAQLQSGLGGAALFTRSPSGLLPTDAAHELRPYAEAMAAAAAALLRTASGRPAEATGVIRLSVPEVLGVEVLPPILAEFHAQHSRTVIELSVTNQVQDLLRRDADIAVRMSRPSQQALLAKRAGKVTLGLYAHRRYLERFGAPQRAQDVPRHAIIGFDRVPPYAPLLQSLPLPITRELFAFRCDNDLAGLGALRAGFGLGLCQHGIARRDPGLVPLLARQVQISLEMWVVMHEDLRRSLRMRLMFEHVAKGLSDYAAQQSEPGRYRPPAHELKRQSPGRS